MRIKALPLSQSKQEKRTEGVITIQRGKDSWNQRPQTSESSTPPLTRAPRTHALPPTTAPRPLCSALPPPTPPFAAHPPPSSPATCPLPLVAPTASCHLLHHHHSSPEHPHSPINPPTSSLNSHLAQSKAHSR
jgi:hypothetical protein